VRLEVTRLDSILDNLASNEVVRKSADQFSASRFASHAEVNVAKMNFVPRRRCEP
jgi:hypothetical protein